LRFAPAQRVSHAAAAILYQTFRQARFARA
jgi:hypothetical protein